jgi:hypothetical protein
MEFYRKADKKIEVTFRVVKNRTCAAVVWIRWRKNLKNIMFVGGIASNIRLSVLSKSGYRFNYIADKTCANTQKVDRSNTLM